MSHRKFEHPRHGSLGFLPRKRAARHRGKGTIPSHFTHNCLLMIYVSIGWDVAVLELYADRIFVSYQPA